MKLTDSIKQKISIIEYASRIGLTPIEKTPNRWTLKEHDSVVIRPDMNLFVWNSRDISGSVIDFAMAFQGIGQDEAIEGLKRLLSESDYTVSKASAVHRQSKPKAQKANPIQFPPPFEGQFSRLYAYLMRTRCIDKQIVDDLIQRGFLYEDDHHNCVFKGFDYDGIAKYGFRRGTATVGTPFRGEMAGTNELNKQVGFYINNHADKLFVSEAAIDNLSIMTLLHQNGRNPNEYNYLSLGGIYIECLKYHITRPENAGIHGIFIATDNDAAGMTGREEIKEMLKKVGYRGWVKDKLPMSKDWNNELQELTKSKQMARENPQTTVKQQLERVMTR